MSSELPTQEEIFKDDDHLVPDWELALIEKRMGRYRTEGTFEEFEKDFEALSKELENEELTQEVIDDDLPVPYLIRLNVTRLIRGVDQLAFPRGCAEEKAAKGA